MNQNLNFLFLFLLLLTTSCKKEFSQISKDTSPRYIGQDEFKELGYGYDILEEIGSPKAVRGKILRIEDLHEANHKTIEFKPLDYQDGYLLSGETSSAYKKLLSNDLNIYAKTIFKIAEATLTAGFKKNTRDSNYYSYATFDKLILKNKISFVGDMRMLKSYIEPNFVRDCETLAPAELVNTYGTHVVLNFMNGAKLHFAYRSRANHSNKNQTVKAGLKATITTLFAGTTFNYDGSYTKEESSSNSEAELYYKTYGGDPTKSLEESISLSNPKTTKINTSNWQSSVTNNNSQIVKINKNGLIPIYEFIEDHEKRAKVKDYILYSYLKIFKTDTNLELFSTGDILGAGHTLDDIESAIMIFPDRPRIIKGSINTYNQTSNERMNTILREVNSSNSIQLFNKRISTFRYFTFGSMHGLSNFSSTPILNALSDIDKIEINNSAYDESHYKVERKLDLIKFQNKIYVRFYEKPQDKPETTTIYPIYDEKAISFYNFNKNRINQVKSISGYIVGPYF
ncbi:MAC/perforin domain-containing protein [Sphingobacterium lactis]|uniref:MAC/Perforin domain-containing protein n=1 Tax=Sphingobacterium lactis TaxID=797291 RepID=A0A1H6AL48_9SPHI|nr:MAC/perforin domain-containing protein [Sphingobacterium lactis]SEG48755.1 MAC/Perforin domain-containing protein [Sphingobacterium lactis]